MRRSKIDLTSAWDEEKLDGPFFDVDINISSRRPEAVMRAEWFMKTHDIDYTVLAEVNVRKLQPHHIKPKTFIGKYIVKAEQMPENVLMLLYDMNEYSKEHDKKILFEGIVEHPLNWDDIDEPDGLDENLQQGNLPALPPPSPKPSKE